MYFALPHELELVLKYEGGDTSLDVDLIYVRPVAFSDDG